MTDTSKVKQVPTVAKVQKMIDDSKNEAVNKNFLYETEYTNIYTIDTLPLGDMWDGTKAYGASATNPGNGTVSTASYYVTTEHKIKLYIYQDNTNKPAIQIRDNDANIYYTYDYTCTDFITSAYFYFDSGKSLITSETVLDVPSIDIEEEKDLKLVIEQNGTFVDVLTFPLKKKIKSITKPDDNSLLTFGAFRDLIYAIGGTYISTNNINPGGFIGGTWETITAPTTGTYAWKRTA